MLEGNAAERGRQEVTDGYERYKPDEVIGLYELHTGTQLFSHLHVCADTHIPVSTEDTLYAGVTILHYLIISSFGDFK